MSLSKKTTKKSNSQAGNVIFGMLTAISFFIALLLISGKDLRLGLEEYFDYCELCVMGREGIYVFAVSEKDNWKKLEMLRLKARAACEGTRPQCMVMIWKNANYAPKKIPLTQPQQLQEVTRYWIDWSSRQEKICFVRDGEVVEKTCR